MAQQSDTVGLPKRLPLALQPDNRAESPDKDGRLVNGYLEKNPLTGGYVLNKRPGLLASGAALTGNGYGAYNWKGSVYAIFGTSLYKDGVSLGAVSAGNYYFSSTRGATPYLVLGNGTNTYAVDGAGTITAISGANFPSPTIKGIVYLDATTYVGNTAANIRGSTNLDDPLDWTDVTNTLTAQIEPDDGVALAKQLVYVIMFKEWSTEVFYDALNATGSPLAPVQGAKVSFGCANADSVQDIEGTLFWLSANRSAAPQVMQMDALKASSVSTKAIDRLFGEANVSTNVYSFTFRYEGHKFYVITVKNANLTLVYDAVDKLWAQWTDANGNYWPYVAATFKIGTGLLLQHETNGQMYVLDARYTSDNGSPIVVDLYTPNFDGGVSRMKTLSDLAFIGDQVTGSVLQVRFNDDDYMADKWTNFRQVDMSMQKPHLDNCGSFIRRATHIRHACDTRLRLTDTELLLDLGVA
jgi:hypothetical protein